MFDWVSFSAKSKTICCTPSALELATRSPRGFTARLVIAAGVGSFQPRRLGIEGIEPHEGNAIHYRVKSAADFAGKRLVIFGGGDSALDWVLELLPRAASLDLVHRRPEFRAAPASVAKMQEQVAAGRMRVFEALPHALVLEGAKVRGITVKSAGGALQGLDADQLRLRLRALIMQRREKAPRRELEMT